MNAGFGTLDNKIQGPDWDVDKMAVSMTGLQNLSDQGRSVLVRGYPGPCTIPINAISPTVHMAW